MDRRVSIEHDGKLFPTFLADLPFLIHFCISVCRCLEIFQWSYVSPYGKSKPSEKRFTFLVTFVIMLCMLHR